MFPVKKHEHLHFFQARQVSYELFDFQLFKNYCASLVFICIFINFQKTQEEQQTLRTVIRCVETLRMCVCVSPAEGITHTHTHT